MQVPNMQFFDGQNFGKTAIWMVADNRLLEISGA